MDDRSYQLSNNINLAVPPEHADKLLSMGDGTCALLYLYALRNNGGFSTANAAAGLKRTELEITNAAERLRQSGLFSGAASDKKTLPAEELPQYAAEDIAAAAARDNGFTAVLEETQRIMGKTLSRSDVDVLFGIYDYLGLPPEVMVLLVNHCVENARERMGAGRLPSMRTIEKEAYAWFNREIMTLEQAERFLQAKRERNESLGEIKRVLQINGRGFSATERSYVESWLEMGFDIEAIALAYDKTVVKTGGLQWKYMNSILNSWHIKGLRTVEEINRGDRRETPPAHQGGRDDSELLKRFLNRRGGK